MLAVAAVYVLLVNLISLLLYRHDALHRLRSGSKIALWKMLVLPLAGGWFGAGLANCFYSTAARRSFYKDGTRLRVWPFACAVAHAAVILYLVWGTRWLERTVGDFYALTGVVGVGFVAMNVVGFFWTALQRIWRPHRRTYREWSPVWDRSLAGVVLLGGAGGMVFAEVLLGGARLGLTIRPSRWFYRYLISLILGPWSYVLAAAQFGGLYYLYFAS